MKNVPVYALMMDGFISPLVSSICSTYVSAYSEHLPKTNGGNTAIHQMEMWVDAVTHNVFNKIVEDYTRQGGIYRRMIQAPVFIDPFKWTVISANRALEPNGLSYAVMNIPLCGPDVDKHVATLKLTGWYR